MIAIGSTINPGDRVVASVYDVIIKLSDGSQLTLQKGATFELDPATPEGISIVQRLGQIKSRVFRGTSFSLKAVPRIGRPINIGVRGTEFTTTIDEDGAFQLEVSEGVVSVTVGERTREVRQGSSLHLAPGEELPEGVDLGGVLPLVAGLLALVLAVPLGWWLRRRSSLGQSRR